MNKREFLCNATATVGMLALHGVSAATAARGSSTVPIAAVMYDERYSDAHEFARELVRRGAAGLATHRNVAQLLYQPAVACIAQPANRLAGFTPYSDLVLIQSWAAQSRLKLLYLAMHDGRGAESLTHQVYCNDNPAELASELGKSSTEWPSALAAALHTAHFRTPVPYRGISVTGHARSRDFPGSLTSWVIGA